MRSRFKRAKRKTLKNLVFLLIILLVITILVNVYTIKTYKGKEKLLKVEEKKAEIFGLNITEDPLSVKDFVEVNINVTTSIIFLTHNCSTIIMTTTEQQTYSIQKGIKEETGMRPTTHDLVENILEFFGVEVLMVKIVDLKEGTYYANLFLQGENKILNLDIKPSDAVAIAVRTDAPIYLKKSLLEEYGKSSC